MSALEELNKRVGALEAGYISADMQLKSTLETQREIKGLLANIHKDFSEVKAMKVEMKHISENMMKMEKSLPKMGEIENMRTKIEYAEKEIGNLRAIVQKASWQIILTAIAAIAALLKGFIPFVR